ncbi:hypothetical protein N826_30975 [Skermanella aerolata KACC 11604]|nr:hypothetical protein N826_30975 [Skermanella aerolata KACC 11604]
MIGWLRQQRVPFADEGPSLRLLLPLRHYLACILDQAGITRKPPHYQAVIHQLQPVVDDLAVHSGLLS